LRYWDDGFGILWVYTESLGPVGIVRAETWSDAFDCVVDEIMGDGGPGGCFDDRGELLEGFYFRGSGEPSNEGLISGIAAEDLNGAYLEPLSALLARHPEFERYIDRGALKREFPED